MPKRRPGRYNFIDRLVLKYLDWRKRAILHAPGYDQAMPKMGYMDRKKVEREDREVLNRTTMPWLYPSSSMRGVPRDTDQMEMRRLSYAPIVQLCIGTRQEEIKKTPWAIIESDQRDKKFISATAPHLRGHEFVRQKSKALNENADEGRLADEAAKLLSNPNTKGETFSHILGMLIADNAEVGDGIWELSFFENDVTLVHDKDKDTDILKIKKGAKPAEITCHDVLQYNKDMDIKGVLHGYWFTPWSGGGRAGYGSKQVYMTKDEIIWVPNDPRSNRYYGYGDVEKARDVIDIILLSLEQESSLFAEGMVSPGAISFKGDNVSEADMENIINEYRENIKGHPERIMFLNKEASFINFTSNYRDLQFLERKLWDNKFVAGIFKLNLQVLGMAAENTNRATAFAEKLIAYEKGIAPKLKEIEYYINTQLIWKYYSEHLSFVFDPAFDIEYKERYSNVAVNLFNSGIVNKNEARKEVGYKEVEGGEEFKAAPEPGGQATLDQFGGQSGGGYDIEQPVLKKKMIRTKKPIYIADPSDAPEGVDVQRGARGGYYYDPTSAGSEPSDEEVDDNAEGDATTSPSVAAVIDVDAAKTLMADRLKIGKPKENTRIGKLGEQLLAEHLEGYSLHDPENWASPFDLMNGAAIEAKTTANGKTQMWGNSRKIKVEEAKKLGKPLQIMLWWVHDDKIELYLHEPEPSFYDNLGDRGDLYMVDAKNSKLMGWIDRDGNWNGGIDE